MILRKKINQVFTPRSSSVNNDMYVERPRHEKMLYRSVLGSMHSFLFGESGSGKTWLYKKVFSDNGINFCIANCANASRFGSITEEIFNSCFDENTSTKVGYTEAKKGQVGVPGFNGELSHEGNYELIRVDKLLRSFEKLSKNTEEKSVIVIDNIESILKKKDILDELADIIILLDDDRYAKYHVKFLLVGVPSEVMEYFSSTKNMTSIGNRIEEVPRVSGLEYGQVLELVRRGFCDHLKVEINEVQIKRLARHVFDITLGIPQRIHEYCECLAYAIEDNNWLYEFTLMEEADKGWLLKGLRESYTVLSEYLNADETSEGRRNQVIYSLGKQTNHNIQTQKIGEVVSQEFPNTAPDSYSGIGQILAYLSKGSSPILKRISNSNTYVFTDPRYLMCIRVILYKDTVTERVIKKGFKLN